MKAKGKYSIVGILIAIVLLLTIVITRCNSVQQQEDVPAQETPVPTAEVLIGTDYVEDTTGLKITIPSEWAYVTMKGHMTFIHKESSSSVQIIVNDYEPKILLIDDRTVYEEINNIGGRYLSFSKSGNGSYLAEYMLGEEHVLEYTIYDRDNIVKIICSSPISNFQMLQNTFTQILNSIVWRDRSVVSTELTMQYSKDWGFEYAVPSGWALSVGNNSYFAQDISTGASMSITINDNPEPYSNATAEIFKEKNVESFPKLDVQKFAKDNSMIYVEATYYRGNEKTFLIRYCVQKHNIEYVISFVAPYDVYEGENELYTEAIRAFRIF